MTTTRRPWFGLILVALLGTAIGTAVPSLIIRSMAEPVHSVPPVVFEDVNDNGVFDAGDRDVTQALLTQRELATAHSVVVTAPVRPPDPKLKLTGAGGCAYIRAGKSITVNASILCPYYDGTVVLWADGAVTVGDKVQLVGRNRVTIAALGIITLGNGVTLSSSGGSANQGAVGISGHGKVAIGSGLAVQALKDISIDARGGTILVGPGASITSAKAAVRLTATGDIGIDGAKLKGTDIDITSFAGAISFRNGAASVPKAGGTGIYSYVKTTDVTGTRFVGPSAVWPPVTRKQAPGSASAR